MRFSAYGIGTTRKLRKMPDEFIFEFKAQEVLVESLSYQPT
jgi:hypothetical protein